MSAARSYRINSPTVINETIDGESVIINLEAGYYYSLDHVGSVIWEAIDYGLSVDDIRQILRQRYDGDETAMDESLERLLTELANEKLIVSGTRSTANATLAGVAKKIPFVPPELNKFGDMQDLLLLDPIHEVDDKGWPFSPPPKAQE